MPSRVSSVPWDIPRPSVRKVLLSPLRPRTYLNLLYLFLAFPLGIIYFVFLVTGVSVGVALLILAIGIPILLAVLVGCHLGAGFERLIARYLLGIDIPSPGYRFLETNGILPRLKALVLGGETWKSVGYLLSKFFIGVFSFVLITTLLSIALALLLTPLYYDQPDANVGFHIPEPLTITPSLQIPWGELLIGIDVAFTITSWEVTTLPEALLMSVIGFGFLIVSFNVFNGVAWLIGQFTRLLLGDYDPPSLSRVRAHFGV